MWRYSSSILKRLSVTVLGLMLALLCLIPFSAPIPEAFAAPGDVSLSRTIEPNPISGIGGTATVSINITGQSCATTVTGADVVVVIDNSGSMASSTSPGGPDKLTAAKNSALTFVGLLNYSRDQVAVVRFDDTVALLQGLTTNPAAANSAISSIQLGGLTNIAGAITTAQAELTSARARSGAAKVIVLLTDGVQTVAGDPVVNAASAKAAGTTIIAIGLGTDVDNAVLQKVATDPSFYYFSPSTSQLQDVYNTIALTVSQTFNIGNTGTFTENYDATKFDLVAVGFGGTAANGVITWKLPQVNNNTTLTYVLRAKALGTTNFTTGGSFVYNPCATTTPKTIPTIGSSVRVAPLVSSVFKSLPNGGGRLFDSRPAGTNNPNPPTGVGSGPLTAGTIVTVQASGNLNIPAGATAVLATVTATDLSGGGFLTVFPGDVADSSAATVNWFNGGPRTVNNFAYIGLSPDGKFKIKSSGTANVIIDVIGVLYDPTKPPTTGPLAGAPGGGSVFVPLASGQSPRIYDSRPASTSNPPSGAGAGPLLSGQVRNLQITGALGIPATASAIIVNLTAVNVQGGGYFTLFPTGGAVPNIASVNWNNPSSGTNIPRDVGNLVIAPLNAQGQLSITAGGNSSSSGAEVVMDVLGYLDTTAPTTSGLFNLLAVPARLYDSRFSAAITPGNSIRGALLPKGQRTMQAGGQLGIPTTAKSLLVRVTTVDASGGGFLALFPGSTWPGNASVNINGSNQVAGNLSVVSLDFSGQFTVYNGSPTNNIGFVIDILGFVS